MKDLKKLKIVAWIVTAFMLVSGWAFVYTGESLLIAFGFILVGFCSCPLSSKIFKKIEEKIKIKAIIIQIVCLIISFFVVGGLIRIHNHFSTAEEPTTVEVITTEETTTELTTIIEETTTPAITTVKVTTAPPVTTTKKVTTTAKPKTDDFYEDVFYKYCDKVNKQVDFDIEGYTYKKADNMIIAQDGSKKIVLVFENNILQQISYHFAGKVMAITMQDDVKKYCIGYASDNEKKCVQKYDDMLQFVFNNADFKAIESTGTITMLSTVEPIVTILPIVTTIKETEPPVIITEKPKPIIRYVYIASSGNGTKYHSNDQCSKMNGDCYQLTMEEAEAQGFEPCKKCYG